MLRAMAGKTRIIYHPEQRYHTLFNPRNGLFARIEDIGADEPMWSADGPELLDISITNFCERQCGFCYRGSSPSGSHMTILDFKEVLSQAAEVGVLQIAFGGGNPNQHPQFAEFLRLTHEAGIVPSYTSNGEGLTDDILKATKRYCGAMALSAYPPYDTLENRIRRISDFGIKLNLHVILSDTIIGQATEWMVNQPDWFKNINAIIFLNYKPIRSGSNCGKPSESALAQFFRAVKGAGIKIGFDSCSISGILWWLDTSHEFVESCEAAKFSAFISEDLRMYPCSFMANTDRYGDLSQNSLLDIWRNNSHFQAMRAMHPRHECVSCPHIPECRGGCSFLPQINLCNFQNS